MRLFGVSQVWSRQRSLALHEMSRQKFIFLVGCWMMIGLISSAIALSFGNQFVFSAVSLTLLFLLSLLGTVAAMNSEHFMVVLTSYLLMAVPFGLTTGPFITHYTGIDMVQVFWITVVVAAVCTMIAALWPSRLAHWTMYPFGMGVMVMAGKVIPSASDSIVGESSSFSLRSWAVAFVVSMYVLYDLRRAMTIERTYANALACAVAVYLDIATVAVSAVGYIFETLRRVVVERVRI